MKKMYIPFIMVFFLLISQATFSQITAKGHIIDGQSGEPLSNVSIVVQGTTKGTFSNNTGNFEIADLNPGDTLEFHMLGYKCEKVSVKEDELTIVLQESPVEMDQLIITSTKEKSLRGNAPISFSKLSQARISEINSENAAQLLNKTSSIHIADFGNEQLSMSIRQPLAFGRSQLVILEDEIPIGPTSIVTGSDAKDINLANIKSIEIIRGPSSSIYGSEAVGGVINFISKRPSLYPTLNVGLQNGSYGYLRGDLSFGATLGKVGVSLNGYYAQRRDGYREHSDYDKLALSGALDFYLTDDTKWENSFTYADYYTDFAGSLDSLTFYSNDQFNQHTFTFADQQLFRFRSSLRHRWSDNSNSFFTFFFRKDSETEIPTYRIKQLSYGPFPTYGGEYNNSGYQSYGTLLQHQHKFSTINLKLIAGLSFDYTPYEFQSNKIDVSKEEGYYTAYSETTDTIQFFNSNLFNSAAYIHAEYSPFEKLKLVGALRYDQLFYRFDNHLPSTASSGAPDESNTFDQISPKLGFIYDVNHNDAVYGNFSVGFSPPLFNSLYKNVIVPQLKPAVFNNYEVGSWWNLFDRLVYIDLSFFNIEGRNELVEVFLPDGSTENQSIGKTRHMGVDYTVRLTHDLGAYLIFNGTQVAHKFVEFNDSEQDYSGNFMSIAPQRINNLALGYRGEGILKGIRIEGEWQNIGSYFIDNANSEKYEGYSVFNIRSGYNWRGFELWLNVLNITDKLYAARVSKSVYKTAYSSVVVKSYSPGFRRTIQFGLKYNLSIK